LGTAREVDEHGGGIGPRQHWQDLMQEGQPLELMNRYLSIDADNDVDAVKQAIQTISKDPNVSEASKARLLGQLGMIIKRYRLPIGRDYYQFMQQYMEDINETALNPKDLKGDYEAKRRALHDLSLNKDVDQAAVLQRRLDLDREAKAKGLAETVTNVKAGMAEIYRRLAPKIERHRDSFLAGQLYDELENYAELHGAEREFKQMMNGARNRAHMEYDTNPGGFHNWFWFLPFEDQDVAEGSLDEIDRRGFLKGLGAAAVAGGAGYVGGVRRVQNTTLARVLGKLNGFLKPLKASNVKDKWSYELITRTQDLIQKYKIDSDIYNNDLYAFGENQGERAYKMAFLNGIQTSQDREKYEAMLFELSADLMNATGFHSKYMSKESIEQGVAESTDDVKKQMSKLEALALAANRAGDDAKCKRYQQKIQSLKQKLSQGVDPGNMEEGYVSTIGPDVAPLPPEKQWKIQVRQLIADYIKNPQGLYNLVKQKGANSAEAAAYKFIMHPAGKIALPPDAVTFEGWSDAIVAQRTGGPRTPYSVFIKGRKWKDFENDDHAEAVANKLRAKFKADGRDPGVITIAPTDISKGVTEDQDTSGVEQAILKRIMVAHLDLLRQYGPEKVMQATEEVAYNVGDVDEIGTSDVSAYVQQVKQILGAVA
jgi:hypothetical protein